MAATPDYSTVNWDGNKPYWNNTDGSKTYIAPMTAAQYANPNSSGYDPKLAAWAKSMGAVINYGTDQNGNTTANVVSTGSPASGFASAPSTWNGATGGWDAGNFFDSSLGGLVLGGGAMAAPFVVGALAGGAAGGAGAGGAAGADVGGSTIADLGAVSGAALPGATAAPIAGSTIADLGAVSGASLPGAAAAPSIADLGSVAGTGAGATSAGSTMSDVTDGIPEGYGSTPGTPTGSIMDFVNTNNPQLIQNQLATSLTPGELNGVSGGNSIMNMLTSNQNNPLSNISSLMASQAQGQANNRLQTGNAAAQFDRNSISAQEAAMQARGQALKQLQQANYVANRTQGYQAPTINLPYGSQKSITLPDFGFGYQASTPSDIAGAGNLIQSSLKTLAPGGTYTPVPFSSYGTPSSTESTLNGISEGLGYTQAGLGIAHALGYL